jgi:tRNA (Thr-GGU) A37 N-methylase
MSNDYTVRPIGIIESPIKTRTQAPKQGSEGGVDAWLEVGPIEAIDGTPIVDIKPVLSEDEG